MPQEKLGRDAGGIDAMSLTVLHQRLSTRREGSHEATDDSQIIEGLENFMMQQGMFLDIDPVVDIQRHMLSRLLAGRYGAIFVSYTASEGIRGASIRATKKDTDSLEKSIGHFIFPFFRDRDAFAFQRQAVGETETPWGILALDGKQIEFVDYPEKIALGSSPMITRAIELATGLPVQQLRELQGVAQKIKEGKSISPVFPDFSARPMAGNRKDATSWENLTEKREKPLQYLAGRLEVSEEEAIEHFRQYMDLPYTLEELAQGLDLHPATLKAWAEKLGVYTADDWAERVNLRNVAEKLNRLGFLGGDIRISTAKASLTHYIWQPKSIRDLAMQVSDTTDVHEAIDHIRFWQRELGITLRDFPLDFRVESTLREIAIRLSKVPNHQPVSVDKAVGAFMHFMLRPMSKVDLAKLLGMGNDQVGEYFERFTASHLSPRVREHEKILRFLAIRISGYTGKEIPLDKAENALRNLVENYTLKHGELSLHALAKEIGMWPSALKEYAKKLLAL